MPRISRESWTVEGLSGKIYKLSGLPLKKRGQWLDDSKKFAALLAALEILHPNPTFADFYDETLVYGGENPTFTPAFRDKVDELISAFLPLEEIDADLATQLVITYGGGKGILQQIEFSKSPYPAKKDSKGLPDYVEELTHVRASLLQSGADAETIRWITESIPWIGEGREMLAEMSRLADEAEKERNPKKKQGAAFDDEEADREFAELEKAMESSMKTDPVFKLLAGQGRGG
jgi:hypothetical protein